MKSISLVFNIILIVAVSVLYYIHFKKTATPEAVAVETKEAPLPFPTSSVSIVYVNTDSLLHNLEFYKTRKAEFEAKEDKIKNDLKAESDRLQSDYETYQQRGTLMVDAERQKTEEQLMARQQSLMKKKDEMVEKLDNEQAKFSDELYSKLTSFLREYNKNKNYSYILGYQKGGGILLANDSLDVTKQILDGLNKPVSKK